MNTDLADISIPAEVRQIIPNEVVWNYRVIPKAINNYDVEIYVNEDFNENYSVINELTILIGKRIQPIIINNLLHNKILQKYYPKNENTKVSNIDFSSDSFIDDIITEAKHLNASDIHFEPFEDTCRIRYRIDGVLIERYSVESSQYPSVVNRIKIISNLDISEKRLPQDGRINFQSDKLKFDIRVSTLPSLYGEKVVLRILNNDASMLNISSLGFTPEELKHYKTAIQKTNGIILISGPTGSGKTTTLYATLKELNTISKNIQTIEDPVEYTLNGINQVQLKNEIGLNFSKALKTFLRQDPDIIMVGEIRDIETAEMAIRAALTGHLVLSTIHTNSALGIINRLIDMGVPSYLVANTLNIAIAQRLVRLLCDNCKKALEFDNFLFADLFTEKEKPIFHYIPTGCSKCFYTGYKGRKAIYEVIPVNSELSKKIRINQDLDTYMSENKIKTISDQALRLISNGETSIEEVLPLLHHQ